MVQECIVSVVSVMQAAYDGRGLPRKELWLEDCSGSPDPESPIPLNSGIWT